MNYYVFASSVCMGTVGFGLLLRSDVPPGPAILVVAMLYFAGKASDIARHAKMRKL
jgi:hypothetical protein